MSSNQYCFEHTINFSETASCDYIISMRIPNGIEQCNTTRELLELSLISETVEYLLSHDALYVYASYPTYENEYDFMTIKSFSERNVLLDVLERVRVHGEPIWYYDT